MTPLQRQFESIKNKYPDCIVFFRLGDFYEMFGADALEGSKILNIALTGRHKGENRIPMCGIPYHAANNYLAKLTKAGKKVAICEQVSDPKLPGLVKREVVKVVTPGTTFDENLIDQKNNNYLVSIYEKNNCFGLACADLTTGEFMVTEFANEENLLSEINRLKPSECLITPDAVETQNFVSLRNGNSMIINRFESFSKAHQTLTDHFKTQTLAGFGLENLPAAIEAAGRLLQYLKDTQKTDLKHITKIKTYALGDFMRLDEATIRNLELLFNNRTGGKEGSLLNVIDQTLTPMGGRLLRKWLIQPLNSVDKINYRSAGVAEFFQNQILLNNLRESIKPIFDIERLLSRLTVGSGNARDLINLKASLSLLPNLKELLKNSQSKILQDIHQRLDLFPNIVDLLEKAIIEPAPISVKDGNIIKDGFNLELDDLRKISRDGKNYLSELQKKEVDRTGINSLKIRFNKVFGYYLEISKANLNRVPEDYIRKQTLINAERYITPELKDYEEKILGAEEKMITLEYQIFLEIRNKIIAEVEPLQKTAATTAALDVISNFAFIALKNNYAKPIITESKELIIKNGRHPVIETNTFSGDFVPNDLDLNDQNYFMLLTGPNMAGKSTYLRQIALIVLMAHLGAFVPATEAKISLVDRIFTRVGASDNLMFGQSTFMVEMQEAANILHHATEKSLIILDEIGRGTSTYDGVSIAWAITEFIHNQLKAKTIFATHYHELIALAEKLPHAKNFSVLVRENETEGVVFLHKVLPGGIDKSYGIEVAKLAGLPKTVTDKAYEVLRELETKITSDHQQSRQHKQLEIFEKPTDPLTEELKRIDVNNLTPVQALQKLEELKKKV